MKNKKFNTESRIHRFPLKAGMTVLAFFTPAFAFAQSAFGGSVTGFVCMLMQSVRIIIPILSTVALLLFFWGIAQFILHANEEKEIAKGRRFMVWAVIALFVMVSFWGIMAFLAAQFDFARPSWPLLPGGNNASTCEAVSTNIIWQGSPQ